MYIHHLISKYIRIICMYVYIRVFQKKLKVLEKQFSMVFLVGHAKRGLHPKFEPIWLKTSLAQST